MRADTDAESPTATSSNPPTLAVHDGRLLREVCPFRAGTAAPSAALVVAVLTVPIH